MLCRVPRFHQGSPHSFSAHPRRELRRVPRVHWPGQAKFSQGSLHPFSAHPRRELRRAPLFIADHSGCRVPGTTIRGSQWGPASAWLHKWVMPGRQEIPGSESGPIQNLQLEVDVNPTVEVAPPSPPPLGIVRAPLRAQNSACKDLGLRSGFEPPLADLDRSGRLPHQQGWFQGPRDPP